MLTKAREAAQRCGGEIVLTGILPTLRKSDLGLENMTPLPRYFALNRALSRLRGGAYEFRIKGVDEVLIKHDSVMLEACNTSFQIHFQVGAEEFSNLYNVAQTVTAPVIAVATNSPLLFGRRLWRETRIALFQQAVDTRSSSHHLRDRSPRVSFGRSWVKSSAAELFKEDIARFKIILGTELDEDPFAKLEKGEAPKLKAISLHNGTVYRWNRACYGITDGKPHLRIENRVLPSGPTPLDEIANAAFWFGLISALSHEYEDITQVMEFEDAAANFMAASQQGLSAELTWLEGKTIPAGELVLESLLPLARKGLARRNIVVADIDRYLGVVEERVASKMTGSQWILTSLAGMKDHGTPGERLSALTAATVHRQKEGKPIATWEPARLEEAGGWKQHYLKVEQFMTTDLFTVHEDEPVDLVASLMDWERIRHVPVEDHDSRLVGLISYRAPIHLLAQGHPETDGPPIPVGDIMKKDPLTWGSRPPKWLPTTPRTHPWRDGCPRGRPMLLQILRYGNARCSCPDARKRRMSRRPTCRALVLSNQDIRAYGVFHRVQDRWVTDELVGPQLDQVHLQEMVLEIVATRREQVFGTGTVVGDLLSGKDRKGSRPAGTLPAVRW